VLVALSGESIGLALVTLLAAFNGELGPMLAALPVAVLLQAVALFGVAWIVAGLGVALPDTSYIISLLMFLLMFLSPIAFEPAMVPEALRFIVYGNPVYYMLEVFRDCLIAGRTVDLRIWGIHAVMSATLYLIGAAFFRHFKSVLVDYE
jgi:ABC-type polysaccharide/polyol phosphate export permease